MIFRWFRKRRRTRLLSTPFPAAWRDWVTSHFALWSTLSSDEQQRLWDIARVMVAEKDWVGCAGLEMTDEIKVVIAAQAALLILNIPHDYYENVASILVYPTGYKLPHHDGPPGVAKTATAVLGHAQYGGPVVLSWRSAEKGGAIGNDGRNLVLHEFAHKLDMLDGVVNGTPQLRSRKQGQAWFKVMTHAFERLQRRGDGLIRDYGATNVAEFFAVVTEVFFEQSRRLHRRHPALYGVLCDFYRQDPARRGRP